MSTDKLMSQEMRKREINDHLSDEYESLVNGGYVYYILFPVILCQVMCLL